MIWVFTKQLEACSTVQNPVAIKVLPVLGIQETKQTKRLSQHNNVVQISKQQVAILALEWGGQQAKDRAPGQKRFRVSLPFRRQLQAMRT